jgi:Na+/H+-dicarboxylate symporter
VPGIPSGGFFVQAPLYLAVGLPPEGLGILIAVDFIPDLFKTLLNLTSYASTALIVSERTGAEDPEKALRRRMGDVGCGMWINCNTTGSDVIDIPSIPT